MLDDDEPPAFEAVAGRDSSPFLITCDHAGRRLPRALGTLGVPEAELERHIAWDIGALGVARALAEQLGGFLIHQTYSRLAIDCNRPLGQPSSITTLSENTTIPGNQGLSPGDAEARAQAIFHPYHARIRQELDRRAARGLPTIFVAMHSFTPVYLDDVRAWHAGVLYNRDARLAIPVLRLLRADPELVVGDNQPYAVSDETDYGVVEYGERRGNPHVELEVRQDLVSGAKGQREWAERFAGVLRQAAELLG